MTTLSMYNSSDPDIRAEITEAATNPLEPGRQHSHFSIGGVEIADPEWDMTPLAPLLDTMIEELDFGDTYDYQPDKLSFDVYGTHELWVVLLRINGAAGRHEFRGPKLKIIKPSWTSQLVDMIRFGVKRSEREDANGVEAIGNLTVKTVYA